MHHIFLLCLCASLASCSTLKLVTFDGASGTTFPWKFLGDPVMGGASTGSFTIDHISKTGVLNGTVALIPFLKAPGVVQGHSVGRIRDISQYLNGSLQMRVRSATPYNKWKIGFSAPDIPRTKFYAKGGFKADVTIEGTEWQTVSVPFRSFSRDTSTYTGECDTVDPDGTKHTCCDKDHPDVCPNPKFLSSVDELQVWAEGAVGHIHLEIESFSVTTEQVVNAPSFSSNGLPKEVDSCNHAVQSNLRYNISTFNQSQFFSNESLAVSVCCDRRMASLAEPQFLFESPEIQLFSVLNKSSGVTTFYDSACGLAVFRAPINRTMAEFEQDTNEHGWPSFRDGEVVLENVRTLKDTGYVVSSCNTHLGSFLPDSKGSRWCIDLSCIAGNPLVQPKGREQ